MEKSTFSPLYEVVRAHLVALRKAAGLSQRDLAERLGRERSFVARIEQSERRVDLVEFYWICRACGCEPSKTAAQVMEVVSRADRRAPSPSRLYDEALMWVREHRAAYDPGGRSE